MKVAQSAAFLVHSDIAPESFERLGLALGWVQREVRLPRQCGNSVCFRNVPISLKNSATAFLWVVRVPDVGPKSAS